MPSEINFFGVTNFRNQDRKFGIKTDDRRRHMYVLGKTGMGKSKLLETMVIQDIQAGRGVAFLDPHGESAELVLNYVPSNRVNDVIYFNPADLEYPIAFNIIENVNPDYKHLVASGLMSVFKKIFAGLWSARMEYILNNAILALLDSPGNSLLGVNRMLTDAAFRKKIVGRVKDPVVRSFWVNEFASFSTQFRVEAISAIQNKVGQFLSSSIIRNIVGQTKSTIDLREVMDQQKILIMDLSKGKVGEDNSALLGAMMVTRLQLAAMSRVDIPESERKDFYLYVDEFQNFATESFATILSEARKYHLNLTVGHQYIAQLTEPVRDAILGNVGTMVIFRVGAPDAKELIKEFEPYLIEENLLSLNKREIFLKLMIDGVASKPFSARTVDMPKLPDDANEVKEKVIRVSRERYGKQRAVVEDKIERWLEANEELDEDERKTSLPERTNRLQAPQERRMPSQSPSSNNISRASAAPAQSHEDREGHMLLCDACGTQVKVTFDPDPTKHIFCRDCLKKYRNGELPQNLPSRNQAFFQRLLRPDSTKRINFLNPPSDISVQSIVDKDSDSEGYVKLSDLAKLKDKLQG